MRIDGAMEHRQTGAAGAGRPVDAVALGAQARQRARLRDAAEEFEGMLLQEMLKPMRAKQGGEEGGGDGGDTLTSFGTEAVARAIAKGGGFGVARQIVRQVTREAAGAEKNAGGVSSSLLRSR